MEEHPENIKPSVGGHSIGRWKDDVLAVDTIGIEQGVLFSQGDVQHSENLHVTERFYRDMITNELVRQYRFSDPEIFVGFYDGVDYVEMTYVPYVSYDCLELSGKNNESPVQ